MSQKKSEKTWPGGAAGSEKRRAKRRPILDAFSLFVVLPHQEFVRLPVHNISDNGIAFDAEAFGDLPGSAPIKTGDELEVRFYFNQSLYLPLQVKVARLFEQDDTRRIGAEFMNVESRKHQAFLAFLKVIDELLDELKIDKDV